MVAKIIEILDPVAEVKVEGKAVNRYVEDLNGKTAGFLLNGWCSLAPIAARFEALLSERYKISQIVRRNTLVLSSGASAGIIEELATKCHVAISALGN